MKKLKHTSCTARKIKDVRPEPDQDFLERMKAEARSLPLEMELFTLARQLEDPALRYDAARVLEKINGNKGAVPFLYLCALDSKDEDFKIIVFDILTKIGTAESKKAAEDILIRKQQAVE